MSHEGWVPPQGVPTLTEVVSWPETATMPLISPAPESRLFDAEASAAPFGAMPSEDQLIQRVLEDVQRQVEMVLDYRLREVLTPILTRLADSVVREARNELASTLRDVVARAVAQELARQRLR